MSLIMSKVNRRHERLEYSMIVCRSFQLLGLALGGGGGMERLHWLLERAFDEDINQLSQTFTSVCTTASKCQHTALVWSDGQIFLRTSSSCRTCSASHKQDNHVD